MTKLESMLKIFILEVQKEIKANEVHVQDSSIKSQVGSCAPVIFKEGEEIYIHDFDDLAKTKRHSKLLLRLLRPIKQEKFPHHVLCPLTTRTYYYDQQKKKKKRKGLIIFFLN